MTVLSKNFYLWAPLAWVLFGLIPLAAIGQEPSKEETAEFIEKGLNGCEGVHSAKRSKTNFIVVEDREKVEFDLDNISRLESYGHIKFHCAQGSCITVTDKKVAYLQKRTNIISYAAMPWVLV